MTIWTLDREAQEGLQHLLTNGVRDVRRNVGMDDSSGNGSSQTPPAEPGHSSNTNADRSDKTLTFAQVGNAVLLASSSPMLDRALAAYTSGAHTLADDPGYERIFQHVPAGAQNVSLIALPTIMEAARPAITGLFAGIHSATKVEDVLQLFGRQGLGLVVAQQYDGKTLKITMFLPLDYDKACHLAGSGQNGR